MMSETIRLEILFMEKGCKKSASGIPGFHLASLTKCPFPTWAKLLGSAFEFSRPSHWQLTLLKLLIHMCQNTFSIKRFEVEFKKIGCV